MKRSRHFLEDFCLTESLEPSGRERYSSGVLAMAYCMQLPPQNVLKLLGHMMVVVSRSSTQTTRSSLVRSSISRCLTQNTAPASSTQAFQPGHSNRTSARSRRHPRLRRRAVGLSSWEPPPSFSRRSARADMTCAKKKRNPDFCGRKSAKALLSSATKHTCSRNRTLSRVRLPCLLGHWVCFSRFCQPFPAHVLAPHRSLTAGDPHIGRRKRSGPASNPKASKSKATRPEWPRNSSVIRAGAEMAA